MIFFYDILYSILLSILFLPLSLYLLNTGKLYFFKDYVVLYSRRNTPVNLFHCVSVGEANAVLIIAERFCEDYMISTTCRETFDYIKKRNSEIHCVIYPLDISIIIRRFLKINNVKRVFISEVDYWPNIFFQCNNLNIPIYIVNARMSEKTYRFYSYYSLFFKKMFSGVKKVYVQNKHEIKKFSMFMPENKIRYYGNLKFENINTGKTVECDEDMIIGGSTHWPEEKFLMEYCTENNIKLIIAPRNTDNIKNIKEFAEEEKMDISFYSKDRLKGRIIIVDIFGVLQNLYSVCKAAYIGGGFTDTGVHNFVEALSAGIPVVIGPETKNFTNEYNELKNTMTVEKVKKLNEIKIGLEKVMKNTSKSEVIEKLDIFFKKHKDVSEKIYRDSIYE